ncbi:hypothetical protein TWF281_007009 [Arthrobotrys megalospora]
MAQVEDAPAVFAVQCCLLMPTFYLFFNSFQSDEASRHSQSRTFDVCTSTLRYISFPSLYSRVVFVIYLFYGPSDEDKPKLKDFIDSIFADEDRGEANLDVPYIPCVRHDNC